VEGLAGDSRETGPVRLVQYRTIEDPAPGCVTGKCQYAAALDLLRQATAYVQDNTGRTNMSQALWCDQGGHAFSERDPGRQRISVAVLDEESGREIQESRDLCGVCAEKMGLLKRRTTSAAAPAIDRPRADPQRIRDLEDELGMTRSE